MRTKRSNRTIQFLPWRFRFVLIGFALVIIALISRMVYLTVIDRPFLLRQGASRYLRTVNVPAYRGMILDRNGQPFAVSTPVDSIWINPQDFPATFNNVHKIAHLLGLSQSSIRRVLKSHRKSQFVYIERNVNPDLSSKIKAQAIPGVYLQHAYRRYYPQGEAASQVVGFTNIDDQGQAGLELAYDSWLNGKPGKERVLKDRYGHLVAVLDDVESAGPGHNLTLSLDQRIQYLSYEVLKSTIQKFHAQSGSVVVLDPTNGQILAMANMPSFNPNNRPSHDYGQFRNRAVTDMFEPGSTMKAFSIASALDSGKYHADTKIDTNPGFLKVGNNIVHDVEKNNGVLTVTQVMQKSSNIGVAKMTLSLPPEHFIDLLHRVGFGIRTRSGFPGESPGLLADYLTWRPIDLVTLSYGYGISVTPLQLAHAYGVIADGGVKCPATFLLTGKPAVCARVMDKKVAGEMLQMLGSVLQTGGTGTLAKVPGYQIAGKTGTAYIAGKNGYEKDHYVASFVGIAPVSDPKLVVAVVVRDPHGSHFGGTVAAPAFEKIMQGALSYLNIAPDAVGKEKE